jgi:cyclohexadienyl dehydratase
MSFGLWRSACSACPAAALVLTVAAGCQRPGPTAAAAPPAVLRVATSGDYAPFSIASDGKRSGMDVEAAARLASDLDRRVEFVAVPWPELAAASQRGDFDVAMSGVTMRADRALVGRYTRPYAVVGAVAVVRQPYAARFPSVDALDRPGVRIAVNAGGHLEHVARARFPRATIDAVPDNRTLPQRLLDGRADAVISDSAEVRTWQRPNLRTIGPFTVDHKAYLLPARQEQLALRIDEWLVAREADGWLDGERTQWLGPAASMDSAAAGREAVAALIRLRLDLMPSVAAAKRAAGLPLLDEAQEARVIERVRGLSSRPAHAEAVYRQLIEMAKAVQRAAPAPANPAGLAELRDAIARIDAPLVLELDRAPARDVDVWQPVLSRSLDMPGVAPSDIAALARTLGEP